MNGPGISVLGKYLKKMKKNKNKKETHTLIFLAVSFIIAKIWK